jgi:hypothetical protein
MPWAWLAVVIVALLLRLGGKKELAHGVARGLGFGVLAQLAVIISVLSLATTSKHENPTAAYAIAAAACFVLGVLSVLGFAIHGQLAGRATPAPPSGEPASRSQKRLRLWAIVLGIVLVPVALTFSTCSSIVFQLGSGKPDYVLTKSSLSGFCELTARLSQEQRWIKDRLMFGSGLALLALTALALPATLLAPVQPALMSDQALVRAFLSHQTNDAEASADLDELMSRPSSRLSGLDRALQGLQKTASRDVEAHRSLLEAEHQAGSPCNNFMSVPRPFSGDPGIALLGVSITRGELAVPKAWAADNDVPKEMRAEITALLTLQRQGYSVAERATRGLQPE